MPVREGILRYRNADGSERRELVTLDAVKDTARTIARAAVTLEHPAEGFVSATNVDKLGVGDVDGEVAVEEDAQGGFARVKLAVRRKDAIDAVGAGTQELSPGYDVTLDETPGEHPTFGRYDARQVGRDVNHLAIVPKGRGGPTVRLRADSAEAEPMGWAPTPSPARTPRTDNEARPMRTLPLLLAALGMTQRFDTDEAAVDAAIPVATKLAADAKARKDAEEGEAEAASEVDKLKAENEQLKADLAKLQGEMADAKKDMAGMVKAEADRKDAAELAELRALATKVGVKHDGLDLSKLRLAVAKVKLDSVDDKAAPGFVDGLIAAVRTDADKAPERSRWDWSKDDKSETRNDADKAEFRNPYLDAADEARTAGGSK